MSWTLSQLGFCAAADRGSRAAGRLLPAGHPSLWSFPIYSRTLTPWAIADPGAETLPALHSAALSRPGGHVKDADLCPQLCLPSPPWLSPACGRPKVWMESAFPAPGTQVASILRLVPSGRPVSDLQIEMGLPARREQLWGPWEPLGSDKEL